MTLREKVLAVKEYGISNKKIADMAHISEITLKRFCADGNVSEQTERNIYDALCDIVIKMTTIVHQGEQQYEEWED